MLRGIYGGGRSAMPLWKIEGLWELKSELGFGRYEGRRRRGIRHHDSLCIASMVLVALWERPPLSTQSQTEGSRLAEAPVDDPNAPPVSAKAHAERAGDAPSKADIRLDRAPIRSPSCVRNNRKRAVMASLGGVPRAPFRDEMIRV